MVRTVSAVAVAIGLVFLVVSQRASIQTLQVLKKHTNNQPEATTHTVQEKKPKTINESHLYVPNSTTMCLPHGVSAVPGGVPGVVSAVVLGDVPGDDSGECVFN